MLALTRKKGESLVVNNNIEITVLEIRGDQVKIGISAPKEVPIYRKEVYLQIQDNTYILVTLTAAADKKDTTVNLKAPLVINTDTRKGCQVIVEDDYPIKFNVYEAVKGRKKAEE